MKLQMLIPCGGIWDVALSVLHARSRLGYWPNRRHPKTFNEFFLQQKLVFAGNQELARTLTDKVSVKEWLQANGFGEYVIPTFFVESSSASLRNRLMPAHCIIKAAHSSGKIVIIQESEPRLLKETELAEIDSWLQEDYYQRGRESNYKGLPRRVIVEQLQIDESGELPKDYKVFCAAGEPFLIQVDLGRFSKHTRQLYTTNWDLLPYSMCYPQCPQPQPAPPQLKEVLDLARRLCAPFKLCRADFYLCGASSIRIGEITFSPGNCAEPFSPPQGDVEVGRLIKETLRKRAANCSSS